MYVLSCFLHYTIPYEKSKEEDQDTTKQKWWNGLREKEANL